MAGDMPYRSSRRRFFRGLIAAPVVQLSHARTVPVVSTMKGPVRCNALGTTLIHEHVLWFCAPGRDQRGHTPIPDEQRAASVDFAVSLLNEAARAGIRTVVDVTPHRPIDLYQEIAARTSVNIVPSTGFYRYIKLPKSLSEIQDESQMEALMTRDITTGIASTSIRAGVIKIASETYPFTGWETKVFRAAARVQAATRVPIITHVGGSARGHFDFLVRNGADPNRICLSHADTGSGTPAEKIDWLRAIAKEGGYLEMDTFGQEFYTPWKQLTHLIRSLCDAGFARRVCISIDCNWHWEDGVKVFEGGEAPRRDPNADKRTYAYMMTDVVPKLIEAGFTRKEVDIFLVENPRRFFCGL